MLQVNLLPWRAQQRQQQQRFWLFLTVLTLMLTLLVAAVGWWLVQRDLAEQRVAAQQLSEWQKRLGTQLKKVDVARLQLQSLQLTASQRQQRYEKSASYLQLLGLLSQHIPDGLWLTQLNEGASGALLYFLLLSSSLQQRQEGQQQNADLQQAILQQQTNLLTQPALAVLLQQQRPLLASREFQPITLLEQITAPLRESKSTLVKWLPEESGVSPPQDEPEAERGSLSVKASFTDLMRLMSELADGPNSPSLDQLNLRAGSGQLDVRFSLTAESFKPKALTGMKSWENIVRDPFAAATSASCPDPVHSFKGVLLAGIIGSGEQRQGWLMWPGAGWQKASPGWRDGASGWQVDAVTPGSVLFDLDHPPCAIQRFKLQLGSQ